MITGKCLYCNNEFHTRFETKKYCNRRCKEAAKNLRKRRANGVKERRRAEYVKLCYRCGVEFKTKYKDKKYCSSKCRFRKKKQKVIRGDSCECCGYSIKEALHAHHVNREKGLGIVTICANCHYIFHVVYGHKSKEFNRNSKNEVIIDIKKVIYGKSQQPT